MVNHYMWEFLRVQPIWRWVEKIILTILQEPAQRIHLTMGNTLIGELLIVRSTHILEQWWILF